MKKKYQRPENMVVKINTDVKILAGSPDAALNPNKTVSAGGIESRSVFFDDDED